MAKIRYSGIVSSVSGKHGDDVHSHNRKVNYVRKKSKKKYVKTEARENVNGSFGNSGRGWGKLTEIQMDLWDTRAIQLNLRSLTTRVFMTKGYVLYNYCTLNLQEIGEAPIKDAPGQDYPEFLKDVWFEFVNNEGKKDIKLYFKTPIHPDTKVILSATKTLNKGQRYVDKAWYKKIGVIDNEFMSGDSIMAQYLLKYKDMDESKYKIHFEYREVNKKSGITNFARTYKMVLFPEEIK